MRTSVGYKGSLNCEIIAATIVMGLWRLAVSFGTIKAGRVRWISAPMVGSKFSK
jgi:hypothetical protein